VRHRWGVALLLSAALTSSSGAGAPDGVQIAGRAGTYSSITDAIRAAADGDTIRVRGGVYEEQVVVDKRLSLQGSGGAEIRWRGGGDVVTIAADGCVFRGFKVGESGTDLSRNDAGMRLRSSNNVIESNEFVRNLFGIYFHQSHHNVVRGNTLVGLEELGEEDRGNGIHIWDSDFNVVTDNDISAHRDGIYFSFAMDNRVERNTVSHLRFGIHYMYSQRDTLMHNVLTDNKVGLALMYSQNNVIARNEATRNETYGILFKDFDDNYIEENTVRENGAGLFLENSLFNEVRGNVVVDNGIGVYVTQGSEENLFVRNVFLRNADQAKYRGIGRNRWDDGAEGNHWSDYTGVDADENGIGDTPYREAGVVGYLVDAYPVMKLLFRSPALQAIQMAERMLPALEVPGVVDHLPLMTSEPGELR